MASPSEQTLLVTGANGFLAGHVIQTALDRGFNVRGTVRSESSADRARAVFKSSGTKFSLAVVPDMTKREAYQEAFAGTERPITGVISVAAPATLQADDNVSELLDPALKVAISVLEAANSYGSDVHRIVVTSSIAALLDLSKGHRPGYVYTEKDWNPMTYEEAAKADSASAYCASKAIAERAVWDWVDRQQPRFSVSTICPPWILGPYQGYAEARKHTNASAGMVWSLLDAKEVPPVDFPAFADVRSVAEAHIRAFTEPNAAGRRFLVGSKFTWQAAVDTLRQSMPELKDRLPVGTPGSGESADVYELDSSPAKNLLHLEYIPLVKSLTDAITQILEAEARNE